MLQNNNDEEYQIDVDIILSSTSSSSPIHKYRCLENGKPMSYGKFLSLLSEPLTNKKADSFKRIFIDALRNYPSTAFFWECISITSSELNTKPIEFVLVDSKELASIVVDIKPFNEKFSKIDKHQQVISFMNLGGDTSLISPSPITMINNKPGQQYAHLANFVRNASRLQVDLLLRKCGQELLRLLQESPSAVKYMSTSGLGVSYLHVRIDNTPKYYQYLPYKQ